MHRRGYLFRQLIALSAVVALPVLGLLAFNIHEQASLARESAYRSVSNYAASIGQDTDFLLADVERYLEFVSTRSQILALDSRQCDPVLEGVAQRRRHFANVVVTDLTGRPVCMSLRGPGAIPASYADAAWWQQASRTDARAISKPFLAPVAQKMAVAVSVPLRAPNRERVGTLTVLLDLQSIQGLWTRLVLPPASRLSVLDAQGTLLITQPDFDKYVGSDASTVLNAALEKNPEGVGVAKGIDGVERVFARVALAQGGWQATAAMPVDAVFANSRTQIQRVLLVSAAIVVLVLALAISAARRLAGHLNSLAVTARAVAAGDLRARASEAVPGEFGELAREFNAMQDARQVADALLSESERRFVDLLDNVEMLALMLDREGRVIYCNDFLLRLLGWPREQVVGQPWRERFIGAGGLLDTAVFDARDAGGAIARHEEAELVCRDGSRRSVRWHHSALRSATGEFVGTASLGDDITQAKDAQHREQRQRDFYKALSRTNSAIVRMTTPAALYQEICAICVEHGHASIAYISLVDRGWVRPVAWSGPAESFLDGFEVTLDDTAPEGRGPTAVAVRSGTRFIANDYENDPSTLPWRVRAAAIGTKASAAFPFRRGGVVAGTLSLHMTVKGFFDDRLVELIDEMVGDTSFALDNFDREAARAAAERQAEADARRFRTLFQAAPVSITISSVAEQRLLDVNDARCAMSGKTREELIGRNAFEAVQWENEALKESFRRRLAEEGRVRNFEMRAPNDAGEMRDYLLQSDLLDFDDQACVLTITNDITELRSAQRKLDERERQLAGLVDTAMDAFITIGADQCIRLFNRAAAGMFGVSAELAVGKPVDCFIPAPLRAVHHQHVEQFGRTGSTARRMGALHTLVGLRADGTEFPIEASISKLGEGDAALMTVVIRDVSELRQAERSRLAQAAAESASRAKTEFLSRMSHELRTPLNAVLGFSQLLQSHPTDVLTANQRMQVEQIRKAGWHLLALINDVLDVTKIEAGKIDVEERSVDVHELLDETYRLTGGMAESQRVRILPDYRAREALRVRADPVRLRQVLINIVSNAIKYNRADGSIRIDAIREGRSVHIDVRDTGMGMSAEQMTHLFEPFNRLGRDRGGIEGTGLGLALTRQLVELMKGTIEVNSEAGKGTQVRVSLRAQADNPASGWGDLPSLTALADGADAEPVGVVLYVEDNPVNLLLVEQLLSRWPQVALVKAETGEDGIAAARRVQPDLVLLDMRLPDMDGLEVLGALRDDAATRELRVVALSASAMPDEVARALKAGARDYWTKPIDFDQFVRGMRQMLSPVWQ